MCHRTICVQTKICCSSRSLWWILANSNFRRMSIRIFKEVCQKIRLILSRVDEWWGPSLRNKKLWQSKIRNWNKKWERSKLGVSWAKSVLTRFCDWNQKIFLNILRSLCCSSAENASYVTQFSGKVRQFQFKDHSKEEKLSLLLWQR